MIDILKALQTALSSSLKMVEFLRGMDPGERPRFFARILVPGLVGMLGVLNLLGLPPFGRPDPGVNVLEIRSRLAGGALQESEGFLLLVHPSVDTTAGEIAGGWSVDPPNSVWSSLDPMVMKRNRAKIAATELGFEVRLPFAGTGRAPFILGADAGIDRELSIGPSNQEIDSLGLRPPSFASLAIVASLVAAFGVGQGVRD